MIRKFIFTLVTCFFMTGSAYAGWGTRLSVAEVVAAGPEDGSGFIVIFNEVTGVTESEGTCSGTHHYFNASTEKGKMIFTLLLTAKMTGKGLNANLVQAGSTTRCVVSEVRY